TTINLSELVVGIGHRPPHQIQTHAVQQTASSHSINLSARASKVSGTLRLSALAVLRLITNSNLVGRSIGQVSWHVSARHDVP
ncbi:MAG: hypothetical protein WA858_07360, partial [Xanthobacteraceae bacterium]